MSEESSMEGWVFRLDLSILDSLNSVVTKYLKACNTDYEIARVSKNYFK